MRWFILTALCAGLAAYAQKNAELEKAQKLLASKKYADALKALEAAEKKGGLDHDSYTTLLESKGLCQASLNKVDAATESFKALLTLDPRRDLEGKYKGEVVKAVLAAQEWVKANGALVVVPKDPVAQGGRVKQVGVGVKSDPLKVAKTVRIHLKLQDGTFKPNEVVLADGAARADVDATQVEYWVEVDDAAKNQLLFVGSSIRPVRQSAPAEVAEPPRPAPAEDKPVAVAAVAEPALSRSNGAPAALETSAPAAAVEVSGEAPKAGSMLRTVSYPVFGAGVIAAAVGIYFGASASAARASITEDLAAGSMTMQMLYDRDQARIGQAQAANALFITAGVLAAAAVLMFIVGG